MIVRTTILSALLMIFLCSFLLGEKSYAQEGEAVVTSAVDSEVGEETRKTNPRAARKAKRGEVKETEGTSAPERFEGNTILKSQYYLEGQSLEVDPD